MLQEDLLEILVCPQCKGGLEYDRVNEKLLCHSCRLRYPIQEDIPVMLVGDAERMEEPGLKPKEG